MSRDTTRHLLLHSFSCKVLLFRLRIFSILSWYFPKDVTTDDICCGAKMNVSALGFLLWISVMLRPTNAEGELEDVQNESKLCVSWADSICCSPQPLLLLGFLPGTSLRKSRHLKIYRYQESRATGLSVARLILATVRLQESWFITLEIFIL